LGKVGFTGVFLSRHNEDYQRRCNMAAPEEKGVFIDKDIPVEKQIEFLRKGRIDRELVTYKILKEKLGEKGEDLYYAIKENLMQQMVKDLGMKLEFEQLKRQTGEPDRILGYRRERDYEKPDELQTSLLNCPYLERAKQHGLEKEICRLICDWEAKMAGKMGFEMAILSKIAEGAEKCTFRLRKK
jgi:predicted ArsR family transcriptional regulator